MMSGTIMYGIVVAVANAKLMFSTHAHTILSVLIVGFSIASFFLVFYLES